MCFSSVFGQSYLFKDGRVVKAEGTKIQGNDLIVTTKSGESNVEMTFPLANIVQMDWPEPENLIAARDAVKEGNYNLAIPKATAIMKEFEPTKKIKGSWWEVAALTHCQAMVAQEHTKAAEHVKALMKEQDNPNLVTQAKLLQIELELKAKRFKEAQTIITEMEKKNPSDEIMAFLYNFKGDIAFSEGRFDDAIESYLHVPIFYGTVEVAMPRTLLAVARAYKKFGDLQRAFRSYAEVIDKYPKSAEAQIAKQEKSL